METVSGGSLLSNIRWQEETVTVAEENENGTEVENTSTENQE